MAEPMHPRFVERLEMNAYTLSALAHVLDRSKAEGGAGVDTVEATQDCIANVATELNLIADMGRRGIDPPPEPERKDPDGE